jgi:hypothetical protein
VQGELVCVVGRKGNIVPCTLMPGVKTGTFPTRANTQHMHARRTRMHMHACLCFHTCAREPHMHARLYVTICMHMRMSLHQRAFVVALELVCIWVRHLRVGIVFNSGAGQGERCAIRVPRAAGNMFSNILPCERCHTLFCLSHFAHELVLLAHVLHAWSL